MIIPPTATSPIVLDNGTMSQQFRLWTVAVSDMSLIIGTGPPEGVVPAKQGREYMDVSGTTGSIKYIKKYSDIGGDRTLGWILI